ncbi:hypothetical protein ACS0TY_002092 [Phlomoides rotata]
MGRGKTKMELIRDEKSRNQTFKRRKRGLIQKLHELTTLCDVSACMIIYGEDKCETWPENVDEINRIIGVYKASGNIKKFDMSKLLTTKAKMESSEPEPTMIAGDCGYLEMIAGGCAQMVNGDYYSAVLPQMQACIDDVFQEGVVPGLENQSDMGSEVYYIG